jgi:cytochrome c5
LGQSLRIIWSVYLKGDDIPVPAVTESTAGRTAEDIYKTSCAGCHATAAIGAPVFGNAESWAPRIAKGEETLFNSAINGFNGVMPAMGTCAACSKDEIKETVKYMIANSQ